MIRLFLLRYPYLSITLGMSWSPGEPQHYTRGQWPGFAIMLAVNLLGMRQRLVPLNEIRHDDLNMISRCHCNRDSPRHCMVCCGDLDMRKSLELETEASSGPSTFPSFT